MLAMAHLLSGNFHNGLGSSAGRCSMSAGYLSGVSLTPHLTEASVLPGGRVPLSGLSRLEILSLLADWTWNSQNDTCNDPPQVI